MIGTGAARPALLHDAYRVCCAEHELLGANGCSVVPRGRRMPRVRANRRFVRMNPCGFVRCGLFGPRVRGNRWGLVLRQWSPEAFWRFRRSGSRSWGRDRTRWRGAADPGRGRGPPRSILAELSTRHDHLRGLRLSVAVGPVVSGRRASLLSGDPFLNTAFGMQLPKAVEAVAAYRSETDWRDEAQPVSDQPKDLSGADALLQLARPLLQLPEPSRGGELDTLRRKHSAPGMTCGFTALWHA